MPCFPGTTLARIIATSCHRLEICSTIFCLSPRFLHTLCILIGLQHPSDSPPPIHIPRALLKNYSCGTETKIDSPGPSSEYYGWPNIFYSLGLIILYTMDPLALPRALYTVAANYISKLSMINAFGGCSFPTFTLLCPGRTDFGAGFIPCPATIVLSWNKKSFCGIVGP